MEPDGGALCLDQRIGVEGEGFEGGAERERRGDVTGKGDGQVPKPLMEGGFRPKTAELRFGS
jgi:hypothetical protein